jgi:hypothetical protein
MVILCAYGLFLYALRNTNNILSTCASAEEALLRVKSGVFCGNSALFTLLKYYLYYCVYWFHRLVRVL